MSDAVVRKQKTDLSMLNRVAFSGMVIMGLLGCVHLISDPFEYGCKDQRPILVVIGLLIAATLFSVVAIRCALRVRHRQKTLLLMIVLMALGFRCIMGLTPPILEIDYYRYLWDGKVATAGVSPYAFSPRQVIDAGKHESIRQKAPEDLETLTQVAAASPANNLILKRVHFPFHTTIYPPVSQAVFSAAAFLTPASAPLSRHILTLRVALILFDVGTILVLAAMLIRMNRHVGWLIAYGWNPLMVKEISNSVHLDSIAIFLMVLSLYLLVRARAFDHLLPSAFCGLSLGFAVGAKIFPVVLAPAIAMALLKGNWKRAAVFSATFLVTSALFIYPMLNRPEPEGDAGTPPPGTIAYATDAVPDVGSTAQQGTNGGPVDDPFDDDPGRSPTGVGISQGDGTGTQPFYSPPLILLPPPDFEPEAILSDSKDGLSSFLSSWRMNDAIFSTLYFNFKAQNETHQDFWYVWTSKPFRQRVQDSQLADWTDDPAFLLARLVTLSLFALVYLYCLRRFYLADDIGVLKCMLFVMFTFLMLQPTVNPWYWAWVIPLTCFGSRWGWIAISGILTCYYSRFYFLGSGLEFELFDRTYKNARFFDHFVGWAEFILIVSVLILSWNLDSSRVDSSIGDDSETQS